MEQDFTAMLTRVKSFNPDAIYFATGTVEVNGNIAQQIDQLGIKTMKILAPGQLSDDLIRAAGRSVEGIISGDMYLNSLETPENRAFVAAFEAINKTRPQKMTLLGYEAITVLSQAMIKARTVDDAERIASVLRDSTFASPRGNLRFVVMGKSYNADCGFYLQPVQSGRIVAYK